MRFTLCAILLLAAVTFFTTPRSPEAAYVAAVEAAEAGHGRKALRLYRMAAEGGHLAAQLAYAEALETGYVRTEPLRPLVAVPVDSAAAERWYSRAWATALEQAAAGDSAATAVLDTHDRVQPVATR